MRRLRDESGVALAIAVVSLAFLMLAGATLVYYAGTNANHAEVSTEDAKSLNLAEAGMNYARSILWNAADPTVSTAVGSGTLTLENGTVTYSGTYDSVAKVWTLTGVGTYTSPSAGASPIDRTVSSQVLVSGGSSWDPAWGYLFADTSGCTNLKNNLTIDAPIYVRGDLCMENSAVITSDLVQVRGKVNIKNTASIGTVADAGAGRPGRRRLQPSLGRPLHLPVRVVAAGVPDELLLHGDEHHEAERQPELLVHEREAGPDGQGVHDR